MNSKLKIAIDTGPLKTGDSVRGIGVYARELIGSLQQFQKSHSFEIEPIDFSTNHQSLITNHFNVFHFTRFNPFQISVPFNKPTGTRFVLTIYDLIPLIYPKHYPSGIKGWLNWQINMFLIKKNIDSIITISETSKKDICRFIGISPDKVSVTHLAPRNIFQPTTDHQSLITVQKKYGLPDRFVLYVGDINYNKNIPLLVEACKKADEKLVIAGKQAVEIDKMDLDHPELGHLKNIDWNGVIRLGFVPDEDLVNIYNLAGVYIQPSLYEGFGLPLLEAQAVGIPVVASKTQALVEIAESSVFLADPKSANDFADKIKLLVKDGELKNKLIDKGIKNAERYSWHKTAEETVKVYKKILNF